MSQHAILRRISRVTLGTVSAAAGRGVTFNSLPSPVTLYTSAVRFLAQKLVELRNHKSPFFTLLQLIHCSLPGCCTPIIRFGYAEKHGAVQKYMASCGAGLL